MAKQSGIGERLYVGAFDVSGDVGALGTIQAGRNLQDITALNKVAIERLPLLRDGHLAYTAFFNATAGQSHPVLKVVNSVNALYTWCTGTTVGDPTGSLQAIQADYPLTRGQDGSLVMNPTADANAYGLEWGNLLTAAAANVASAANGTAVDGGASQATAVTISTSSIANPTVITTATPHLLTTGDSVLIAGHSGSTPTVNGSYTATVTGASTFTVPVNVSADGTGGTVTRTSTSYGAAAYLHVLSLGSGTATVRLQDSADNSTFANLGSAFTAVTGATSERLQLGVTAQVKRYVRINVAGTFTNLLAAVALVRYVVSPNT